MFDVESIIRSFTSACKGTIGQANEKRAANYEVYNPLIL
jgi:hypothetical protein